MSSLCRPPSSPFADRRIDRARAAGYVRRPPSDGASGALRDQARASMAVRVAGLSADLADLARWLTQTPFPHDRTHEGHRAEVLDALAEARRKLDGLTEAVQAQEF